MKLSLKTRQGRRCYYDEPIDPISDQITEARLNTEFPTVKVVDVNRIALQAAQCLDSIVYRPWL